MTNTSSSFFETQQFNAIIMTVLGFIGLFLSATVHSFEYVTEDWANVLQGFFFILSITSFVIALIAVHKSYDEDKQIATDSSV